MPRILALAACAVSLGACTASDLNVFRVEPTPLALKLESTPPGAEAKVSTSAPPCKTPCEVPIEAAAGTLTVVFSLEGYHPQEVTIQVVDSPGEPTRAVPNPVTAELEAAPRPPARRRPARKRQTTPKKQSAPKQPSAPPAAKPAERAAPAPANPPEPTGGQAPAATQSSPWNPPPQQQRPQSSPWPDTPSQQQQQQKQ